jgi:hypothetical protein
VSDVVDLHRRTCVSAFSHHGFRAQCVWLRVRARVQQVLAELLFSLPEVDSIEPNRKALAAGFHPAASWAQDRVDQVRCPAQPRWAQQLQLFVLSAPASVWAVCVGRVLLGVGSSLPDSVVSVHQRAVL